ncbi:MAG: hypothetical protein LBS50_03385 [Prevotellaceae bacterium]|jgi:ankyrin repeat protein|nr:hypothetical protein [Prevotellaceae bacterium]
MVENHKYTDNKLDNALFNEVLSKNPSEQKICNLITNGANVNAIDNYDNSILMCLFGNMSSGERPLNLPLVKLLIDLGVDLNYEQDGTNCLYVACLTCKVALVELLLQSGANPNCIVDEPESLLDWAEFEQRFATWDNYGQTYIDGMGEIIDLLVKYGAKHREEM